MRVENYLNSRTVDSTEAIAQHLLREIELEDEKTDTGEHIKHYAAELFMRGWSKDQFLQWVRENTPAEHKQGKVDIKTAAAKLREAYPHHSYNWFIIGVADTEDENSHLVLYTEEAKYQWAMQNMPTIWMDYVVVVRKGGCPLIMLSEG
jgi:hypothetical protein